jgi:transcriptional regulator with XRE-family HTH domain
VLAAARVLAGLTQRECAHFAGIAVSSLARYETGLSNFRSNNLEAVLIVLLGRGVRFSEQVPGRSIGIYLIEGDADGLEGDS